MYSKTVICVQRLCGIDIIRDYAGVGLGRFHCSPANASAGARNNPALSRTMDLSDKYYQIYRFLYIRVIIRFSPLTDLAGFYPFS